MDGFNGGLAMDDTIVNEIYKKFVRVNDTPEYRNRYVPLPLHLNNQKWKWEKKDFPRVIALLEFKRYMEKYNFNFDKILSFNGQEDPEYQYISFKDSVNINYTDDIVNNDLHRLNLSETDFDFVMLNQTFEHLYDPISVAKSLYTHLKDGGIFYCNVPSNNRPHSTPYHYYTGFTPVGLGVIMKLAGFEILEIGQWGNRQYLNNLFRSGWTDYRLNNSVNEINCPVITWILAVKRGIK